ncbi:hypothetical protein GGX14DRAFT_537754 [Mycena pura]|uniref:Uncharacterized protein n=1 Tax=Mycena pura TaxID=153505 RepID=A0AAD6UQA5_9AGAR|nr:hypothetical protein GGX14DRAFT_537754 [Mycena pura]
MEKHGITRTISIRTARRYLRVLGYRFMEPKKGQYADGHEREDVTSYRDGIYVPRLTELQRRTWKYSRDGLPEYGPHRDGKRVIIWYHDESIFYAHDRRRRNWYHKDAPAKLYQKGDGHSLMVADFVSQDFGWSPTSLDGTRTARRFLKPGKNRDGYFTCDDICEQANVMMDIVTEVYPDFEHAFVYDNATTHKKRADGSLSARKMPKGTKEWETETGKVNGKMTKTKMTDATFNGQPQPLYFPSDHPQAGLFKGMAVILQERGLYDAAKKLLADFANRCLKFADAYSKGLNGRQAAWAARKYRGHRVLPESILRELEEAEIY